MTDHSQLVKTLEWKANSLSSKYPSYHSFKSALRLHYSIKTGEARSMGAFALFLDLGSGSGWVSAHVSLDAAKATAQADYTARILSALNLDAIDALQARVAGLEVGRIREAGEKLRHLVDWLQENEDNPTLLVAALPVADLAALRALIERN